MRNILCVWKLSVPIGRPGAVLERDQSVLGDLQEVVRAAGPGSLLERRHVEGTLDVVVGVAGQ